MISWLKSSSPELYNRLAPWYDVGQKYGLYLLGALGGYSYEAFAAHIVDAGGIGPGARVLDAACGTGYLFSALADQIGPSGSIVGVDFSEGQIARARQRAARLRDAFVTLELARIEDLGERFPPNSFDAVYCAAALPVLADPETALREMGRVLRPGSRLVIWTICREALDHARFRFYWNWSIRKFDLKYYTQPELSALLAKTGYESVSFEVAGLSLVASAAKPVSRFAAES